MTFRDHVVACVAWQCGVHGAYNFLLPDLAPGAIRELRDPDALDEDEDET